MNSEERIIKVLKHEETDRIPIFEWTLDRTVIDMLNQGLARDEFINLMDMDAICADLDYQKIEVRPGIFIDEWGIINN